MTRLYYRIKQWLTSTVVYSIFFWKEGSSDWDWRFAAKLVRFKLVRMADCIEKNEIIEANKRVARQIRYAVYLTDQYGKTPACDAHYKKWGTPSLVMTPDNGLTFVYPNLTKEQAKKEDLELMNAWSEDYERDLDIQRRFFKHTSQYFRGWWD